MELVLFCYKVIYLQKIKPLAVKAFFTTPVNSETASYFSQTCRVLIKDIQMLLVPQRSNPFYPLLQKIISFLGHVQGSPLCVKTFTATVSHITSIPFPSDLYLIVRIYLKGGFPLLVLI